MLDGDRKPQFGLVVDGRLKFYSVADFPTQDGDSFGLDCKIEEGFVEKGIDSVVLHNPSDTLMLDVQLKSGSTTKSTMFMFQRHVERSEETTSPEAILTTWVPVGETLRNKTSHLLGISDQNNSTSLVFLHANSWVSSIPLRENCLDESLKEYTQHFFAPSEFISYSHEVPPVLIPGKGDVVFCMRGELAIIRNGLKFEEVRLLDEGSEVENVEMSVLLRTNSGFQSSSIR